MPAFPRTTLLLYALLTQQGFAHGILPENVKMAAGTALRQAGTLPAQPLRFDSRWHPHHLQLKTGEEITLTLTNRSEDWHLFALGSATSLRDQQKIHRLMPDLRKDFPNTRLSESGSTVALPWRFDRPGIFHLRCVRATHQDLATTVTIQVQ